MSTPSRSTKNQDPALVYAPPRVRDQTQQMPIEPSLPRAEWPLEIQRFGSISTFGDDHAIRGTLPVLALQPEGVPGPPEANSRGPWKIALWACSVAGLAALGVWTMVLGPGARLFGHQDSREDLPVAPASFSERAGPAPSMAAPKPSPTVESPAPALVTRHLDRDEVASLINRGEGLIKSGDLSSARLALRRAAEAGDVHAALLLAGTFDPNLLEKLGFQEQGIDVAMARYRYERAAQLGSAEAPGRLQQLATKMPLH